MPTIKLPCHSNGTSRIHEHASQMYSTGNYRPLQSQQDSHRRMSLPKRFCGMYELSITSKIANNLLTNKIHIQNLIPLVPSHSRPVETHMTTSQLRTCGWILLFQICWQAPHSTSTKDTWKNCNIKVNWTGETYSGVSLWDDETRMLGTGIPDFVKKKPFKFTSPRNQASICRLKQPFASCLEGNIKTNMCSSIGKIRQLLEGMQYLKQTFNRPYLEACRMAWKSSLAILVDYIFHLRYLGFA